MRVTCINKKQAFQNLTVGTEYEAIEDGDLYIVTNNIGARSRYAKHYFRPVPAAPVIRPLAEMVTVSVNEAFLMTITLNRTTRNVQFQVGRIVASCGVASINNIGSLDTQVKDLIRNKVDTISGTEAELFAICMDALMARLRATSPAMLYLFSDVTEENRDTMIEVLDNMSTYSYTGTNPNTNHEITLWAIEGSPVE